MAGFLNNIMRKIPSTSNVCNFSRIRLRKLRVLPTPYTCILHTNQVYLTDHTILLISLFMIMTTLEVRRATKFYSISLGNEDRSARVAMQICAYVNFVVMGFAQCVVPVRKGNVRVKGHGCSPCRRSCLLWEWGHRRVWLFHKSGTMANENSELPGLHNRSKRSPKRSCQMAYGRSVVSVVFQQWNTFIQPLGQFVFLLNFHPPLGVYSVCKIEGLQ